MMPLLRAPWEGIAQTDEELYLCMHESWRCPLVKKFSPLWGKAPEVLLQVSEISQWKRRSPSLCHLEGRRNLVSIREGTERMRQRHLYCTLCKWLSNLQRTRHFLQKSRIWFSVTNQWFNLISYSMITFMNLFYK